MAKQRQEEEEHGKERERRKAEKKAAKEKKKGEMQQQQQQQQQSQQQRHRQQTQNGNIITNGKLNKKEQEKKNAPAPRKENRVLKKNSSKWSYLSFVNIVLLLCIVISSGFCAVLYTEGDLTVSGLQTAWPRLKVNSDLLFNKTKEKVNYENLRSTAVGIWKVVGPYSSKVLDALAQSLNATKNIAFAAVQALQTVTGDLSPYFDGVKPLWDDVMSGICSLWSMTVEWFSKVDWNELMTSLKRIYSFFQDQITILYQEFWMNEAILSAWKETQSTRDFVWSNTESLRYYWWQLYEEVSTKWLPVVRKQGYNLYIYGRTTLENAL